MLRGASISFLLRCIGTLLGFTVSVAIARLLGAEGSGIYYLALSASTIAATLGQFGFENTVVRFVAARAEVEKWGDVSFVYRTAVKVVALASLLAALLLLVGAPWFAEHLFGKPDIERSLICASFAVVPFALTSIQSQALRGLKEMVAFQSLQSVMVPLGTLLLLYPAIRRSQAEGAIAAYVTATFVTAILAGLAWRRAFRIRAPRSLTIHSALHPRILFQSSGPLFGVTLTALVMQHAPTLFLGIWGSVDDIGVFNVANRVANLLLFPLFAMISTLAPKFAVLHQSGKTQELAHLVRHSSMILGIFAVCASTALYLGAEEVMKLFGQDFTGGIWPLRILLCGVLVNVATGAVGELLIMTGHERWTRNLHVCGAALIVALCLALLPRFGAIGAAFSVGAGYAALNLAMVAVVRIRLGFWPLGVRP
ncbi:flippase [Methylococcus geothermalis]|uniref:flippase n=1 Tax=Methylococcus geothermalis TaxID=2681310 RepID=UPI001E65BB71|nr:flippase [Methylococcus geothermalis]